jgi:hypothetical protein
MWNQKQDASGGLPWFREPERGERKTHSISSVTLKSRVRQGLLLEFLFISKPSRLCGFKKEIRKTGLTVALLWTRLQNRLQSRSNAICTRARECSSMKSSAKVGFFAFVPSGSIPEELVLSAWPTGLNEL